MELDIFLNSKPKRKLLSVKKKTIILVLAVYLILSVTFLLVRYADVKGFITDQQNSELEKVKLIYKVTREKVKKFYITRGYANLNSFGIQEAFQNKDIKALHSLSLPRWNIIKKENPYLNSFCFYDKQGNLLNYFGQKPDKYLSYIKPSKETYTGFWFSQDAFNYHVVIEAKDKQSNTIGYIVFVIDPKYFLSEIKNFIDIYAYIAYHKSNNRNIISMLQNDKTIKNIIDKHIIDDSSEINTEDGIFIPHVIRNTGLSAEDDFQIIFLQDISHYKEALQISIIQSLLILFILIFITTIIINYGFDVILKKLDQANSKLRESQNRLKNLNKNLQIKIEEETYKRVKKEREANEKERILLHQSKLASMGEMIGNIAHQWRQPLAELSSILINLELYFERDRLTKEKFKTKVKEANDQISFMSKTINDFKNFFTSNKKEQEYKISSVIDNVRELMNSSLKKDGIKLQITIEDDFLTVGYPNEILQALLNIITNAKDIILQRDIKDGYILIKAYNDKQKKVLLIEDNAQGIKFSPIEKIFEPYVSSKHPKIGTGIGLYMTKTIIEKNNHAAIDVKNMDKGALFTITF